MNGWSGIVLGWLLPGRCLLCGARTCDDDLCAPCLVELPRIEHPCVLCGLSLPQAGVCPTCLTRPPPLDRTISALPYEGPGRALVHALKFEGRVSVAGTLARLLLEAVESGRAGRPDLVLPVPLHPARLRARGFNQATEVARRVAGEMGLPLAPAGACQRRKATRPQSGLEGRAARARNVRGAFRVDPVLRGSRVAIVDDVMTTGATLFELARGLRRAGVSEVQAWVCCRAFRHQG